MSIDPPTEPEKGGALPIASLKVPPTVPPERVESGHPKGLYVLFFAEMWERFSYYGMRALLMLYMTKALLYGDKMAYGIYGAYTSLVYATPVIGGLIADRILGYRKAIVLGGILMALGHFAMAIEHPFFFYSALSLLVAGNGFFKPNISSIVGKLYAEGDPRRDGGFTIFYMGINLGAFFSPLVCGLIGEKFGWHWGFGLAGVGMVAGLIVFTYGQKYFEDKGLPPNEELLERKVGGVPMLWAVYAAPFVVLPLFAGLIIHNEYLTYLVPVVFVVVFAYLIVTAIGSSPVERDRLFVVMILTTFTVMFWTFFEQAGSSLTLYTDRNVDRHFFGIDVPASVFQSVNPALIVLLAPMFASMWIKLDRINLNPSTPLKFALGILQLGVGFAVLVVGTKFASGAGMVPMIFLVLAYLLHTTGELCLSPVGLSMVTKLSPAKIVGVVMGTWFLSSSVANFLGGHVAKLMAIDENAAGEAASAVATLPVYTDVFGKVAMLCIAVGLVLVACVPVLKKWMHGVK